MGKYLKVFDNHNQYAAFTQTEDFVKPNVSHCIQENEVHYNPYDYSDRYLTFVALEDGTFSFDKKGNGALYYSTDLGETWDELASGTSTPTVTAGNRILWKGEIEPDSQGQHGIGEFSATGNFDAEGNIMSLLYGDDFEDKKSLEGKGWAFTYLFDYNEKIINAKNLSLPATTLSDGCYYCMFDDCTSLISAPKLPATTLTDYCYEGMFGWCSSLTEAPELPATTLTVRCYEMMFCQCSSLRKASELPATTLANQCYHEMFEGCAITTAPQLPATVLANDCYRGMFSDCTSLANVPSVLPAMTLADSCYCYMFKGCTSLTTAPQLPATDLVYNCYAEMFRGCTMLINAPELPAVTLADRCYHMMFSGCTNLNYIKAMFTNEPQNTQYGGETFKWVEGVSPTGTFVKNSAAEWDERDLRGANGVPSEWTVQTASE